MTEIHPPEAASLCKHPTVPAAIAYHEAAHLIACLHLGLPVFDVSLSEDSGLVQLWSGTQLEDIAVALSGPIASIMTCSEDDLEKYYSVWLGDFAAALGIDLVEANTEAVQRAEAFMTACCLAEWPSEWNDQKAGCELAEQIVKVYQAEIAALSDFLHGKKHLTADQIQEWAALNFRHKIVSVPVPASKPVNPAANAISKFELKQGYENYKSHVESHGLAFGKLCYDYRAQSEVVQGGTTFRDTLAELGIPKSTAYYWITRYEISSGKCDLREKYPEFEKEYNEGWEKVKNGEQSLSTFVRQMDWLKSGGKTEEAPFTVGGAAQTFLRLLSYETALPTYQDRRNQLHQSEQEMFDEAWSVVKEGIYATSL